MLQERSCVSLGANIICSLRLMDARRAGVEALHHSALGLFPSRLRMIHGGDFIKNLAILIEGVGCRRLDTVAVLD